MELTHPPTASCAGARRFWKFPIELSFVVHEFVRIHQYWCVLMSRLAGELDRGKIKCRRSALVRKKQKKQETKDKRYISRCAISNELEHSNDHWQRSSIEREKHMETSNMYRSTDQGRNPIWLLSHYITVLSSTIIL